MPAQQNTYRKLDRDTSKNKVDKQSMYDCRNFRIIGDDPNESGALVNVLGNDQLISSFPGYTIDTIIGSKQIRDTVVLITTNSSDVDPVDTYGRIWKWDFKTESVPTLLYSGLLDLSRENPIGDNIITRYESESVIKVYWADGYNYLRYCNIAEDSTILLARDPDDFNIVNDVSFEAPTFEQILGGKIPVGRVQYAYRLYKKYGGQTIFSPASGMINLTTSNENAADTSTYRGAERLDDNGEALSSGKSVKMVINNVDTDYDKIEIVAIHYADINEAPNINIVVTTEVDSTIHFIDSGVYEQGYYSITEYTALSNLFVPKAIASKKNILFAANVKEEEFDVDYDARAYRFSGVTSHGYIQDSGQHYYINWSSYPSAPTISAYGGAPSAPTLADIPESWDCIQDINDLTIDPGGTGQIYQGDGATIGGEGLNVSYEFKNSDHLIDDSGNDETFHVGGSPQPYYFPNYASPYNCGYRLSLQRDEIYRYGIVLFSTKGQPAPIKWIGDIRTPTHDKTVGVSDNRFSVTVSDETYSTRLWIEFTVNNLPDTVSGFQIVRVERKAEDRTVLFQGKMSFFGDQNGLASSVPRSPSLPEYSSTSYYNALTPSTNVGRTLLWVMSPEIAFYKDYKAAPGDYAQVIGYYGRRNETISSGYTWHRTNKYDTFTPLAYSAVYKKSVNEGYVKEPPGDPDGETNQYSFAGHTLYNGYLKFKTVSPVTLERCNTGSAALMKIDSSFNLSALPASSWPIVSYRRPVVQYGGNTHEARLNNKYITASEYIPKTSANMTINAYGGDTYVQFFDHISGFWNQFWANGTNIDTIARIDMFPVETTINLDLRHDDCWHRIYNAGVEKYYIKEVGNASFTAAGTDVSPGWTDYYLYNTVFSRMPNARSYIQVPEDYELTRWSDAKVIASQTKLNNEEIDSWTQFPLGETKEVDANYGSINYLVEWNERLLFWQSKGFGTLSVLERSLIQDNTGRDLTLGEGDILQRFDMISTEIGCSTRNSLIATPQSVIWYDHKQRRLRRLHKTIDNLGMLKGMNSYLQNISENVATNDNPFISSYESIVMAYNSKFNEVWFTVKASHNDGETLVFNELLDDFTLFIDNDNVTAYINQDDLLMTQALPGAVWKENSESVERCNLYGTIKDAVVEVIVNPAGNLVHTLTNIELTTEIINDSDQNILDETISTLRVTNDYQDTGDITLVPDDNIIRLLRTWRINQLWDQTYDARLRDTYSKIKLIYTNQAGDNRKVILHDLISIYAMPVESVVNKQ